MAGVRRVIIVAGEASGDKLGKAVMCGLKSLLPDVEFAGVGGPLMEAEGLASIFPMTGGRSIRQFERYIMLRLPFGHGGPSVQRSLQSLPTRC